MTSTDQGGEVKVNIDSEDTDKLTTNDNVNKEDDNKKKEEEEIPNLGGKNAVVKLYGKSLGIWFVLGSIVALANGCVMPLFGTLFREIMNSLFDSDHIVRDSLRVCIWYVVVGASACILTIIQHAIWGYYGEMIGASFRKEYFQLLLQQEVGYHDMKNSGTLNTKLISESKAIAEGSGIKMAFALQNVGTILLGFTLAFLYSELMTLVLLACVPVLIIVGILQSRMFTGSGGQNVDPFVKAGSFSNEVLINIKTVVAMPKLTESKIIEYGANLAEAYPVSKKRAISMGVGVGGMLFGMFGVVYSIGLWYGSGLVDKDKISIGDMFGCYFSFLMAGMGLGQLGSVANDLKAADMAANIFLNLRNRVPKIRPPTLPEPLKPERLEEGEIVFDNVVFSYPTARNNVVLHGVSFTARPGSTIALVGPSGSGKSTVINLIERYYDPEMGDIRIDGQSVHNYDINFLRSQIGYVSQLPLLFDTSIKENIRGGNEFVTDEMIYEAAKQADAHQFIEKLADGYNTRVGEMGDRLSGGQKQRICIARAIVTKPKILLLDEATSALDTKSEREVQAAIDKIAQTGGRTIVVIAHRLSTIKNADLICVLVEGEIDEMGRHDELMQKNGVYAVLCKSQALVEKHRTQSDPMLAMENYNNGNGANAPYEEQDDRKQDPNDNDSALPAYNDKKDIDTKGPSETNEIASENDNNIDNENDNYNDAMNGTSEGNINEGNDGNDENNGSFVD